MRSLKGRTGPRDTLHAYTAAILGMAAFVLASPTIGISFLAPIPVACIVWSAIHLSGTAPVHLFCTGWMVGVGWAGALFFWLINLSWPAAIGTIAVYAMLPGLFALSLAPAMAMAKTPFTRALLATSLWVCLVEYLSSDTFAALPPYGLGYFLWETPILLQSAEYVGSFGAGFWLALLGTSAALTLHRQSSRRLVALVCLATFALFVPAILTQLEVSAAHEKELSDTFSVAAIRTLRKSADKDDPLTIQALLELTEESERIASGKGQLNLIVWPETAVPVWLRSVEQRQLVAKLGTLATKHRAPLLVGAHALHPQAEETPTRFNAAFLVPSSGFISQEYHKVLLAPGPEKSPLPNWLPENLGDRFPSRLGAGNDPGFFRLSDGRVLGVFICWEVFFPQFVRQLSVGGSEALINMSNDEAAFGSLKLAYDIPLPHLVMRAIENRRTVVRSSNGGASIAIDASGNVTAVEDGDQEQVLVSTVKANGRVTFYAQFGNLLPSILALVTAVTFGTGLIKLRRDAAREQTLAG